MEVYHESATPTDTARYTQPLIIDRLLAHLQSREELGHVFPISNRALARALDCSPGIIPALLMRLHQDGWIDYTPASGRAKLPSTVRVLRGESEVRR